MKLHDHIQINAPPASVWKVLSDPNLMELWNSKCIRSNAGKGPFFVGFDYQAIFKLNNNPEQTIRCTIEEYDFNQRLITRYSGFSFNPAGFVTETYQLVPKRQGTLLRQTADYTHSGIPWFAKLIMKLIGTFGYKAGRGPLDGIKELAEGA